MTNDEMTERLPAFSPFVIRHSSFGSSALMARILLTSGPPVSTSIRCRYLSNGSSGRMGKALAEAALEAGHEVVMVSGPVEVRYPQAARVLPVISTEEMLAACLSVLPDCDGLIAAAAPCDYRPKVVAAQNPQDGRHARRAIRGNAGHRRTARRRSGRRSGWSPSPWRRTDAHAGDAEAGTQEVRPDRGERPAAMHAADTKVEVIDAQGEVLAALAGSKRRWPRPSCKSSRRG